MDDIVECGVDVLDPFQSEAMDIWALRKTYRGKLAFWGGFSVQKTMPYGTPDDVRAETEKLLGDSNFPLYRPSKQEPQNTQKVAENRSCFVLRPSA